MLRRLDRIPMRTALLLGLLGGLVAGAVAVKAGAYGLAAAAIAAVAAAFLAWSGQPLGIWERDVGHLLEMIPIAGGTFVIGSPEDEPGRYPEEIQHQVTVPTFLMSRTTVTRGQYLRIMGPDGAPQPGGHDLPATEVSWLDAVEFCNRLSEQAGLEPCYRIWGRWVRWTRDSGGYRLPTEAEWEYAARAGTEGRWSFGDDEARLGDFAWFDGNSRGKPHPVAMKEPNPWGLYDIHGNIWEWCWEPFAYHGGGSAKDPRGRSSLSGLRVVRGGGYWNEPRTLRSANRGRNLAGNRVPDLGFRCVRRPRRQP